MGDCFPTIEWNIRYKIGTQQQREVEARGLVLSVSRPQHLPCMANP